MGPYVVQHDTPLGKQWLSERAHYTPQDFEQDKARLLRLTTRMYALARVTLGDVNIAATTALQVLYCSLSSSSSVTTKVAFHNCFPPFSLNVCWPGLSH